LTEKLSRGSSKGALMQLQNFLKYIQVYLKLRWPEQRFPLDWSAIAAPMN